MGWVNQPMVFGDSLLNYPNTEYPVKDITEVGFDGSFVGCIDEDKVTAVQRIVLDAMFN